MRAVTFSTPEVQNAINNHFVALNSNIEGDPLAGSSVGHAPNEQPGDCIRGNGRQNVQTLFMTPDMEIFHVATGFVSPEDMLEEMSFAAELFNDLKTEDSNRFDLVRVAHNDQLKMTRTPGFNDMMTGMNSASRGGLNRGSGLNAGGGMTNPMQMFSDRFVSDDHRYMVNRPLISMDEFERDPGELVGRGKTFFSSSKSSSNR